MSVREATNKEQGKKRLHLVIHGKVQGVGYRAWVYECASQLQLSGWVQNIENSRVEILAEGFSKNLSSLLQSCFTGPKRAQVTSIEENWLEFQDAWQDFSIRYP